MAAITGICAMAQTAGAQGFKNQDLLRFNEDHRYAFYSGVFMTLGHVAFLKDQPQGNCIWNWYFKQPEEKFPVIEHTLQEYPNHTPTAVLMGLMQAECGKF